MERTKVDVGQLVREHTEGLAARLEKPKHGVLLAGAACSQAMRDRAEGRITQEAEEHFLATKGEARFRAAKAAVRAAEQDCATRKIQPAYAAAERSIATDMLQAR